MSHSKALALTAAEIRQLFTYDPETGEFHHRSGFRAGRKAGCVKRDGYVLIGVNGTRYAAHRLAWLHHYGEHAPIGIDHRDRDRTNNRIDNLRLATDSQNQHNRVVQKNSSTGIKGVTYWKPTGKWWARIKVKGNRLSLGHYATIEDAASAYRKAALQYHGEFAAGLHPTP